MTTDIRITTQRHGLRTIASGGSPWEPKMGYSRGMRVGSHITISGTVGVEADGSYSKLMMDQTARSLAIIRATLEALGGKLEHVVRTRIYTTDISQWELIAAVHGKLFGEIRPATSLVQVAKLIDAAALVEIEADAIVD